MLRVPPRDHAHEVRNHGTANPVSSSVKNGLEKREVGRTPSIIGSLQIYGQTREAAAKYILGPEKRASPGRHLPLALPRIFQILEIPLHLSMVLGRTTIELFMKLQ